MIDLDEGEQILLEVRKHWFVLLGSIFIVGLLAVAPPLFLAILASLNLPISVNLTGSITSLGLFLYTLWLLGLWMFAFVEWTDYYLDVWYVTNKRVVDVEQKGIFYREVSSLHYGKIQDITIEIRGLIPTFLGFGDVHVQTAGETREIILRAAARPEDVKRIISNQIEVESGTVQKVRMVTEE